MDDNYERLENNEIEDSAEKENESIYFSVTSYGADYSVDGIISRLRKGQIFIPEFQRKYVWDIKKASRFIESLIIGLPVPGIFLSRDMNNPNKMMIVDGQQRLLSLKYFYEGRFNNKLFKLTSVCPELEGLAYQDLSQDDQERLNDAIIHATIIKQDSPSDDDSSIYMVFERLNTGGAMLQPQEIRACIYHGEFNNLLNQLVKTDSWRSLFSKESNRMKEQELLLRFFALFYTYDTYKKGLKLFLNEFMKNNRNLEVHSREELESLFTLTIDLLYEAKGKDLFRKGKSVNAAIFDSVMIGVAKRLQTSKMSAQECKSIYDRLLGDADFQEYTSNSTADEKHLKGRVDLAIRFFA